MYIEPLCLELSKSYMHDVSGVTRDVLLSEFSGALGSITEQISDTA